MPLRVSQQDDDNGSVNLADADVNPAGHLSQKGRPITGKIGVLKVVFVVSRGAQNVLLIRDLRT